MSKKEKIKHKGKMDRLAAVRGIARKEHFESGGSTSEWTGTHAIHNSKKRVGNRSNVLKKSIKDSSDSED